MVFNATFNNISAISCMVPDLWTPLFLIFNSSLLCDVFIINSVEQLQTLPKPQSEIDIYKPISKNTKTLNPLLYYITTVYNENVTQK